MSDDYALELDAADEAAQKLIKAYGLCGELCIVIRTGGAADFRLMGEYGRGKEQAALLRIGADRLDVPVDRTLN